MGMYDTIMCEVELPKLDDPLIQPAFLMDFQTKSFDCALELYLLTKSGTLAIRRGNLWVPTNYTGTAEFHTNTSEQYTGWVSLEADFKDGVMSSEIRIRELKPIDPDEEARRRAQFNDFWSNMAKENS